VIFPTPENNFSGLLKAKEKFTKLFSQDKAASFHYKIN